MIYTFLTSRIASLFVIFHWIDDSADVEQQCRKFHLVHFDYFGAKEKKEDGDNFDASKSGAGGVLKTVKVLRAHSIKRTKVKHAEYATYRAHIHSPDFPTGVTSDL